MPGKVPPPYPPEVPVDAVRMVRMVRELGASLQEVADVASFWSQPKGRSGDGSAGTVFPSVICPACSQASQAPGRLRWGV